MAKMIRNAIFPIFIRNGSTQVPKLRCKLNFEKNALIQFCRAAIESIYLKAQTPNVHSPVYSIIILHFPEMLQLSVLPFPVDRQRAGVDFDAHQTLSHSESYLSIVYVISDAPRHPYPQHPPKSNPGRKKDASTHRPSPANTEALPKSPPTRRILKFPVTPGRKTPRYLTRVAAGMGRVTRGQESRAREME